MRQAVSICLLLCSCVFADPTSVTPPRALRESTPSIHAITNAKIVVSPTQTIDKGTIVIRDGVIVAVGANVTPPPEARVHDAAGKTIYAGFIDACSEPAAAARGRTFGAAATPGAGTTSTATDSGGATHWNPQVLANFQVARNFSPDSDTNRKLRAQGFVARLAVPTRGLVKGTSAVVETSDDSAADAIMNPAVFLHLSLTPSFRGFGGGGDEERYPTSPMGAFTLVRQTFYDAQWYAAAVAAQQANRSLPAIERNAALEAFTAHLEAKKPFMIDAQDELYALRAGRIGGEFNVPVVVRGSGQEYRRLNEVAAMNLPIVVPVNFSRAPNVGSPESAMNVSLTDLMDWDLAPDNPTKLQTAGVKIAFGSHGLRDKAEFLKNLRRTVARGLDKTAALTALTTTPAELLGVSNSLGTIESGKAASFVITDGDIFADKTKVIATWVDGKEFEIAAKNIVDVRGKWSMSGATTQPVELNIEGEVNRPTVRISKSQRAAEATTEQANPNETPRANPNAPATSPSEDRPRGGRGAGSGIETANVNLFDVRLSFTFKTDTLGEPGVAMFSGVFESDTAAGTVVQPNGEQKVVTLKRTAPPSTSPSQTARGPRRRDGGDSDSPAAEPATTPSTQPAPATYAVNYPLGDFGRDSIPDQPKVIVFKNATVWTAAKDGTVESTDVRIESGKIAAIGQNLPTEGAVVIDCAGKHLAPGIIDCHSHMATDGGVNEGGQNITAEVRIGDYVDPDDIDVYRQLASGITAANVLHGSANAIGGQNQVIKLRWGAGPESFKLETAPQGIKFALGENPRGANNNRSFDDPRPLRYPQTRMGVDQLIRNAFAAAKDYRAAQAKFTADPKSNLPVRKDLELEAIAEILEGKRWIHCHSYRQDEILALLRTCDEFGVKIGSLQHILEGYKVADAIAKHGATASSFSDWWAYKAEVYDAIPHNGALLFGRGVIVSFNSDDAEMARRLNTEAAKATKYGNVPPLEALKFVTLNPAKQLRIDDRVGSIEVGKDADLAVWSAPPMSMYAICEQTWVDGRKYFDREEDAKLRTRDSEMRQKLIQKILTSGEPMAGEDDEATPRERDLWPKYDEYCGHHHDHDHE